MDWHCFNHRLELAVNDAITSCSEVNYFKHFMDKLYYLYSQSPKSRRALEQCTRDVGGELLKIGRILDVRWAASSFRSVHAVWKSYAALHKHFTRASTDVSLDVSLDGRDRAQYLGLAKKLGSAVFLKNLALMHDALEELSELSEFLQSDSITLP